VNFLKGGKVMTVKEVLLAAADGLELGEKARAFFDDIDADGEGKKVVDELLRCYNLIENEVALDFFPLYEREEVETDGEFLYADLSKKAISIFAVTNARGEKVAFKLFPAYFQTAAGKYDVLYTYAPQKKGVDDACEMGLQAMERVLIYGVATEYCLTHGLFEEAEVWERKYKKAISNAYHVKAGGVMRSRRWA
jgi:hypothetical protein